MTNRAKAAWEKTFSGFFSKPYLGFAGTGWENYYAKLLLAMANGATDPEPLWVGVELTHPTCDFGYVGVMCAEHAGEVLSIGTLQTRITAMEGLRSRWPDTQLRFVTELEDLRTAARRSIVFGAVVDAGSTAALSLAVFLAKEITEGNTQTALRVLTLVAPPSSPRRGSVPTPLPPTPAPFDALLRSKTDDPWREHSDLARMCAGQRVGLLGVDFNDVCGLFMKYRQVDDRCISMRSSPVGAKAEGSRRGPVRAASATKESLRGLADSIVLSRVTGAVVAIMGDAQTLRMNEYRTAMKLIREACPNAGKFVLSDHHSSGYREFLGVQIIAVTGGPLD